MKNESNRERVHYPLPKKSAAVMVVAAVISAYAGSPLDEPSSQKRTFGSEIQRGASAILFNASFGDVGRDEHVVQANMHYNRDSDGFLFGATVAAWWVLDRDAQAALNCPGAVDIIKRDAHAAGRVGAPAARDPYEAADKFRDAQKMGFEYYKQWRRIQLSLKISDEKLCELCGFPYASAKPLIARYAEKAGF